MNILFTMVGLHDPYSKGVDGNDHAGPILTLLGERKYNKIYLFTNKFISEISNETKKEIEKTYKTETELREFLIDDPTDYVTLLREMKRHYAEITVDIGTMHNINISVTSGTPHMHACWLMLVASGEIPASIINVRNKKFVSKERPLIEEIDYTHEEFPKITSRATKITIPDDNKDVNAIIEKNGITGDDPFFKKELEKAAFIAPTDARVLILGETGTGKELFAKFIHDMSNRANKSFVPVNCAAIPNELVESILFGHVKGAFTGATGDKPGQFHIADGGTLFLDEIGELPAPVQAKLLRVLNDNVVIKVGENKGKKVDVRIIAATHRDLPKMISENKFREDLYHRLNVGIIRIPPLRERRIDIPKIAVYELSKLTSLRTPKSFTKEALKHLQSQYWKGNIRDLKNTIERSALYCRKDIIDVNDLELNEENLENNVFPKLQLYEGFDINDYISEFKKKLYKDTVDSCNGNKSRAALLLGITPQAIAKFYNENISD